MEQVPLGTETVLAEYLHRQLSYLEQEVNILKRDAKRPKLYTDTFTMSTSVVDADPGTGFFRIDNANWTLATNLFFDNVSASSQDALAKLRTLHKSDEIFLQDMATPGNTATYRLSNNCTLATGYFKCVVALLASTGAKPGVNTNFTIRFTQY
jgi:hypothetical protein